MKLLRSFFTPTLSPSGKSDAYQATLDAMRASKSAIKDALILRRRHLLAHAPDQLKPQAPDTAAGLVALALADVVALTHGRTEAMEAVGEDSARAWRWVHTAALDLFRLLVGEARLPSATRNYEMGLSLRPTKGGFVVSMVGMQGSRGRTPGEALDKFLGSHLMDAMIREPEEIFKAPEDVVLLIASLEGHYGQDTLALACLLYLLKSGMVGERLKREAEGEAERLLRG